METLVWNFSIWNKNTMIGWIVMIDMSEELLNELKDEFDNIS